MSNSLLLESSPFVCQDLGTVKLESPGIVRLASILSSLRGDHDLADGNVERSWIAPHLRAGGIQRLQPRRELTGPAQPAGVPGVAKLGGQPQHPGSRGSNQDRWTIRSRSARQADAVDSPFIRSLVVDDAATN